MVVVGLFVLALAGGVRAQSFGVGYDAVPGRNFDAATSTYADGVLTIGIDSGSDPNTFVSNAFQASNFAYFPRTTSDTISFVVVAPEGFYVAGLTYEQQGFNSTGRTAVQRGNTHWVVAGYPALIGEYTNPNVSGSVDLTALQATSVPVSITASLFVGPGGNIAITAASVTVTLAPLPDVQTNGSVVSILD
jgi:hypothetical protein